MIPGLKGRNASRPHHRLARMRQPARGGLIARRQPARATRTPAVGRDLQCHRCRNLRRLVYGATLSAAPAPAIPETGENQ